MTLNTVWGGVGGGGGYDVKLIDKHLMRVILISCLKGVWKMSERSLGDA